jgi:LysM repeat protein
MPNYNTQGITSADPRNLGGSEGYGNPSATSSSGLMSNTSNATAKDDDKDEPGFFESIANLFSGAGADLPSDRSDDDGDSGISFYDSPMFTPYDGGSDDSAAASTGLPFSTTTADRAMYEALGVDVPEVYTGKMGEEEPEPNLDMDVLQKALQPEPITVEEIEVKAGDTLTAIAEEKGVPVQDVIDANPQIKNPDLIRPGEIVSMPAAQAEIGLGRAPIMSAQQDIGQARAAIIMKGIDKLFGLFPPKTDIEKKTKSELEYFLDAQPESSLPDFFKYVPDKVQLAEYMKGRAERKKAAGVTEADTLSTAGKLLKAATDPEAPAPVSEDPDREFYQSGIPLEDREFEDEEGDVSAVTPPEADAGEGLMSPVPPVKSLRPKARPEGLTDDDMGLPDDDNYMGVLDDGPTQDLLDRIALGEGADPKKLKAQDKYGIGSTEYDMVYGYGSALAPDKPVTEMTMKELETYQRKLINATKGKVKGTKQGTSAVGKYQVIKTSLFGKNGTAANPGKNSWADKLGLTEDTVYTPAIQEKIGFLALKEAGYNSYINGNRSQDSFQNRIANIWASVAKADGTDKYGQGIHTVKKDLEPMFKSLAPIKTDDTAVETSPRPQARN